jgi:hypothetical protein
MADSGGGSSGGGGAGGGGGRGRSGGRGGGGGPDAGPRGGGGDRGGGGADRSSGQGGEGNRGRGRGPRYAALRCACVRARRSSLSAGICYSAVAVRSRAAGRAPRGDLSRTFFRALALPVSAARGRIVVKVHANTVPVRPPKAHPSTHRQRCVQTPGGGSKHLLAPLDARMHLYIARIYKPSSLHRI